MDKKKFLVECILVSFGDYLSYGVLFLITILISRHYGVEALADFTLAITISQILILPLGSAFSSILRREVAIHPQLSGKFVSAITQIRLSIIGLILLGLIFFIIIGKYNFLILYIFVSKGIDHLCESVCTAYQASDKIFRCTVLKTINASLLFFSIIGVLSLHYPIEYIYYVHVVVSTIGWLVCFGDYIKLEQPSLMIDTSIRKLLLNETWPLIVNSIFFQIGSRISIIIIAWYVTKQDLGVYSACINIISSVAMVTNSIGVVLFAQMSKIFNDSPIRFIRLANKFSLFFFIGGIVTAAFLYILSPFVVKIYGKLPENAILYFQLLSIAIIAIFTHAPLGSIFTISRLQKQGMYYSGMMTIISIGLYFFCTMYFGLLGACVAFIAYQYLNVFLEFILLNKYIAKKIEV